MSIWRKFKNWQKGIVFGFLFTLIIAIIQAITLIIMDISFEKKGLPHMCFAFTEAVVCSFGEAVYTRIGFIFVMLLVFGIPAGIFGGLIGYLIDKVTIGR